MTCFTMELNRLPTKKEGRMIALSLLSYLGLGVYNQKMLVGKREDEALMTFMAWVWLSSFVMMLGGVHKLKFCVTGTLVLFSNMPVLSLIGLGWIGAFESMLWLCFEAPQVSSQKQEILSKKQKRLAFIRKTVLQRTVNDNDPLCGDSCAICLLDFQANDQVCSSPNSKCNHGFHQSCAEKWLSQHVRCPCCRENYLQKAGRKNAKHNIIAAMHNSQSQQTSTAPEGSAPCLKHR